MGSICRARLEEKALKLLKDQIKTEKIVVVVSGGVPYVHKNKSKNRVVILDIDNLEDITSEDLTLKDVEELALSYCG